MKAVAQGLESPPAQLNQESDEVRDGHEAVGTTVLTAEMGDLACRGVDVAKACVSIDQLARMLYRVPPVDFQPVFRDVQRWASERQRPDIASTLQGIAANNRGSRYVVQATDVELATKYRNTRRVAEACAAVKAGIAQLREESCEFDAYAGADTNLANARAAEALGQRLGRGKEAVVSVGDFRAAFEELLAMPAGAVAVLAKYQIQNQHLSPEATKMLQQYYQDHRLSRRVIGAMLVQCEGSDDQELSATIFKNLWNLVALGEEILPEPTRTITRQALDWAERSGTDLRRPVAYTSELLGSEVLGIDFGRVSEAGCVKPGMYTHTNRRLRQMLRREAHILLNEPTDPTIVN